MTILKKISRANENALDEVEIRHDICGKPVAFFASGPCTSKMQNREARM
jgi:hypothetical protein